MNELFDINFFAPDTVVPPYGVNLYYFDKIDAFGMLGYVDVLIA